MHKSPFLIPDCRLLLFEMHPREQGNLLESHLLCTGTSCPVLALPPSLEKGNRSSCQWHLYCLNMIPTPKLPWVNTQCNFSLWFFVSEVPTHIFLIRSEVMTSSCFGTCLSNTSVIWWWRTRRWNLVWSKYRAPAPPWAEVMYSQVCWVSDPTWQLLRAHCIVSLVLRAFSLHPSHCIFKQPCKAG